MPPVLVGCSAAFRQGSGIYEAHERCLSARFLGERFIATLSENLRALASSFADECDGYFDLGVARGFAMVGSLKE